MKQTGSTTTEPFKLEKASSGGHRIACYTNRGQIEQDCSQPDNVIKSIKHTRKLPDGIYIHGKVQGYPLLFTADTGASRTIISRRFYEEVAQEDKPILSKTSKLVGASGVTINELGKCTFIWK